MLLTPDELKAWANIVHVNSWFLNPLGMALLLLGLLQVYNTLQRRSRDLHGRGRPARAKRTSRVPYKSLKQDSCHLYDDCLIASMQVAAIIFTGTQELRLLTMGVTISSLLRWFICIHLSCSYLTVLKTAFSSSVQYRLITKQAPRGGLQPPLAQRL
jgi:hypothetical protein